MSGTKGSIFSYFMQRLINFGRFQIPLAPHLSPHLKNGTARHKLCLLTGKGCGLSQRDKLPPCIGQVLLYLLSNRHKMKLPFLLFLVCAILLGQSCAPAVPCFELPTYSRGKALGARPLFDKQALRPLRKEWKELYLYLKQGHIQQFRQRDGRYSYIYSHAFYGYLLSNLMRVHKTPFLQQYGNFISTFGEPEDVFQEPGKFSIAYWESVVDDPCATCNHQGFGYSFDAMSLRLLME